jgi:hypothetical protein
LSSKPALANSSQDPISKKTLSHKRAGGVAQGVGPEFKPQYHKKKKIVCPCSREHYSQQPMCKMIKCDIHVEECNSHILTHAARWMNLEDIKLSEISQT